MHSSDILSHARMLFAQLPAFGMGGARGFADDIYAFGAHKTHHAGRGREFHQLRPYLKGDDPRIIDWRASGKRDDILVRERIQEGQRRTFLACDSSASMRQDNKYERALLLLLALALYVEKRGGVPLIPAPHPRAMTMRKLAHTLINAQEDFIKAPLPKKGARFIMASDGFMDMKIFTQFFTRLAKQKISGLFLLIHSHEELTFPYKGDVIFKDAESQNEKRFTQIHQLRTHYLKSLHKHHQELKKMARNARMQSLIHDVTLPPLACFKNSIRLLEQME